MIIALQANKNIKVKLHFKLDFQSVYFAIECLFQVKCISDCAYRNQILGANVKSQTKQLAKQLREIKDLEFIVLKHRTRVQRSFERARMNRLRFFRIRDILIDSGLMKKKHVNKEALEHHAQKDNSI